MEVLFPSTVRVPGVHKGKNSGECPRGEGEQQGDGGIEPEGLGDAREILAKRETHEVGEINQTRIKRN